MRDSKTAGYSYPRDFMADGFYYQKIWTTKRDGILQAKVYEVYTNAKAPGHFLSPNRFHEHSISLLLIAQKLFVCKYFNGKYSVTVQG